jgi:hypothetical protein
MTIKRKKKHGRVYLEEYKSIRIGGKVKSIYVKSIGPENPVSLEQRAKPKVLDRLEHGSSYRAGDVTLLLELAYQLDFIDIIDSICCGKTGVEGPSPGKFLTAWAINRVLDPISATNLEKWIPTTDIPRLMGLSPSNFTKEAFLTALDFVCYEDRTIGQIINFAPLIDDGLYRKWRERHPLQPGEKETLAYDLTSVLFFGVSCPLAEIGYNAKGIKRRQVNLALLVSKRDKYPITHFIYNGSRNTSSTVKNLMTCLINTAIEAGTIIWDRGNVSKEHVKMVESAGWKLICGVPKTLKEARDILDTTAVPLNPSTFVHKSRLGHIYAVKTSKPLFSRERSVVVYVNQDRRISKINSQNEALAEIGRELDVLGEKGKESSEAELHKEIKGIVGSWKGYVHTRVKRKGNGSRIEWKYKTQEIARAEHSAGKYILLSTDEALLDKDVVNTYFEKDIIEKVFRTFKTLEEIEPVRHRLEQRVKAYIFVCVLAYRLLADLQYRLRKISDRGDAWGRTGTLLLELGRVERVQVRLGRQVKTWYLNVTKKVQETLRKIGFPDLLKESIEIEFEM